MKRNEKIEFKVNGDIRAKNVRVVGDCVGSSVVTIEKARDMAKELSLDLVLIHDGETPVVRLCNYEKFLYKIKKEQKEQQHKNKAKPLKEIQLTSNISQHDLETKAKSARKFLSEGSKVKVVLTRKGREIAREENKRSILSFVVMLEDCSACESPLKDNGNKTIVILKPRKK